MISGRNMMNIQEQESLKTLDIYKVDRSMKKSNLPILKNMRNEYQNDFDRQAIADDIINKRSKNMSQAWSIHKLEAQREQSKTRLDSISPMLDSDR